MASTTREAHAGTSSYHSLVKNKFSMYLFELYVAGMKNSAVLMGVLANETCNTLCLLHRRTWKKPKIKR